MKSQNVEGAAVVTTSDLAEAVVNQTNYAVDTAFRLLNDEAVHRTLSSMQLMAAKQGNDTNKSSLSYHEDGDSDKAQFMLEKDAEKMGFIVPTLRDTENISLDVKVKADSNATLENQGGGQDESKFTRNATGLDMLKTKRQV